MLSLVFALPGLTVTLTSSEVCVSKPYKQHCLGGGETRQNANLPPVCTVDVAMSAHHTLYYVREKVVFNDLYGLL